MSRYIDYDAINYRHDKIYDKSDDFLNGVVYMAQRIEEAPSIDIVRCRECEYWNTKGCQEGVGECEWAYYMTKPDDFCSYGSRSEKPNNSKERSE